MAIIKVDVISDVVCVWCFVGKRTLDKAISIHRKTYPDGKSDEFRITWRPYYLGNYSSPHSIDKSKASKAKFANTSPEQLARMKARMDQIGKSVGINFKHGGKIGHTRNAHRLLHFTQEKHPQAQDAVVEGLFHAYHELEKDITDLDVLGNIAVQAGMDADEVQKYLQSDADVGKIDSEAQSNREQVTTGVPTFLIQDKYRVDGAQDLHEFVEAFGKVREEDAA